MTLSFRWPLLALAGLATMAGGRAVVLTQGSPAPTPVIVELFTSEGCSSCPPADALLIDLMKAQPVRGAMIVGLSEHVDYWDDGGWKDPFSSPQFTRRQSTYAARLDGSNEVYTPQVIVDGAKEAVGSDRSAVVSAITRAAVRPKPEPGLTWTSTSSSPLALRITLAPLPGAAAAAVYLAVTEDGLTSAVRRGENAGRQLTHSGVTRRLAQIGKADANGSFHADVPVAVSDSWKRASLHAIVFVQDRRGIVAAGVVPFPR